MLLQPGDEILLVCAGRPSTRKNSRLLASGMQWRCWWPLFYSFLWWSGSRVPSTAIHNRYSKPCIYCHNIAAPSRLMLWSVDKAHSKPHSQSCVVKSSSACYRSFTLNGFTKRLFAELRGWKWQTRPTLLFGMRLENIFFPHGLPKSRLPFQQWVITFYRR